MFVDSNFHSLQTTNFIVFYSSKRFSPDRMRGKRPKLMKELTHKNLLGFLMALALGQLAPTARQIIDPLFVDEAVGFGWWSRILHTF